jgi:GntR family transcriptional regulator, rspAB operon transcriptional repressor
MESVGPYSSDVLSEPRTKSEHAYLTLRKAIVIGEIGDGEVLDDSNLMNRYAIGRTPLREALKRLTLEQLVVWPAHRTPYVRGLGATDIHHLAEARYALEVPTAHYAAERMSMFQAEHMEDIWLAMRNAEESGDTYTLVELDHELHSVIAAGSQNRFLSESVSQVNCSNLRLWFVTCRKLGVAGVYARHAPIIEAIRRRDGPAAGDAMRQHIANSAERHAAVLVSTGFFSADTTPRDSST